MSDLEVEKINLNTTTSDEQQSNNNSSTEWTLRIKAFKDVHVSIGSGDTVGDLKQSVQQALSAENRYLRLICKGRLLAPDASVLTDFGIQDGEVVHAVLAAAGVR